MGEEMPPSRSKYKRVTDLYVRGVEVPLEDYSVLYVRALNPFEMEEARHDAQTARSRLILALREHGSDELAKVEAQFAADGRETAIQRLIDAKSGEFLLTAVEAVKNDPDWNEKLDIMDRSDDIISRPQEDVERKLLTAINEEYISTVGKHVADSQDFLRQKLEASTDEQLTSEYIDLYVEHHGSQVALAEHRLTEMWYGVRCCEGVPQEDGTYDHSKCDGHKISLFATKEEAKECPEALMDLLVAAFESLSMSGRDARFSDRQGSSSESSPLPSDAGALKPSTQTEMSASVPGT